MPSLMSLTVNATNSPSLCEKHVSLDEPSVMMEVLLALWKVLLQLDSISTGNVKLEMSHRILLIVQSKSTDMKEIRVPFL